jgi:hypothetical protein
MIERIQNWLLNKRRAYRAVFLRPEDKDGQRVLSDLASFCLAHTSRFHVDAREHARLEGRHEVWIHIRQTLDLTDQEFLELYRLGRDEKPKADAT